MEELLKFLRVGMQDIAFCMVMAAIVFGLGLLLRIVFDAVFRR